MSSSIKRLLVKASVWFFQGDIQWRSQFLLSVDINSFTLAFAAVDGQQVVFIYLFLSWRIRNLSSHTDLPGAPRRRRHRARKRSASKKKKKNGRQLTVEWRGWGEIQCVGNICSLSTAAWSCEGETSTWRREETSWTRSAVWEPTHTHLCHLVFRCEVTDQRSTDWLKLDWEVWTSSNFFLSFFCSIFKEASPDPSPHVGLTSPSAKTEAGYLTSCCFLWEKSLIALLLFKSRVNISRKYSSFDYSNRFILVQLYVNVVTLRRLLFCLQIHWNYWLLFIAFGCFQIKLYNWIMKNAI